MTDDRRMTTDRFYGGVSDRLQNLRAMLQYIRNEHPPREQLNEWVITNTKAGSSEAVDHHLAFLNAIDIVEFSKTDCELGEYGQRWLDGQDPDTLYEALSAGVKGFETILAALQDQPMTDEDIMNLLVSEFDEAEMSTPGPAIRHREWLQVLGYVERENGVTRLTEDGRELVGSKTERAVSEASSRWSPPPGISVGDHLTQEEIESAFNTGFGYRISGINPRRDDQDRRYILLFANEDGPYSDSVTEGRFTYIGEGLSGDQSEDSSGNSALIDACISELPIHFFYKRTDSDGWEYQGLVDALDYEVQAEDGREILVFSVEHRQRADDSKLFEDDIAEEYTRLEQAVESEPQLTEDETQYSETRRRAREAAFRRLVREAYDEQCAICGSKRESPTGTPEVEAAHIYPKEEGGSDDVRNGIGLCKLHHWAFDTGWLSLSDEHEVLVKEAPERSGYYEFKQLEEARIQLPEVKDAEPHRIFLEAHRRLHGFTDE